MTTSRLRITEIFHSIQGEGLTTGAPSIFIRLTACPLRCVYCDTEYAFNGGEWMSIDEIVEKIARYDCHYITVTGGEPLAQASCIQLLISLCDLKYGVSLETSGALDISKVDPRVTIVMDIKTPASGEQGKNRLENLSYLKPQDQIKFVICNEADYAWSKDVVEKKALQKICTVLFSPVWQQVSLEDLAQWILRDQLFVRLQVQLHKVIWGDEPGR